MFEKIKFTIEFKQVEWHYQRLLLMFIGKKEYEYKSGDGNFYKIVYKTLLGTNYIISKQKENNGN